MSLSLPFGGGEEVSAVHLQGASVFALLYAGLQFHLASNLWTEICLPRHSTLYVISASEAAPTECNSSHTCAAIM